MTVRDNVRVKSLVALSLLLVACAPETDSISVGTNGVSTTGTSTTSTSTTSTSTTSTSTTKPVVQPIQVLPAAAAVGETVDRELTTSDGRTRTYHLYIPSALPAGAVPLLIALHGGTGWGTQFQRNSGFDELAEANGFLVVFPDGLGLGDNADQFRTWNGGYCCGTAMKQDVDDVGFINALIDAIVGEFDVDANRVFAAGHSNGGIMSYRLACELSDRIVAIGLQAGSLGIDECAPSQPVSVLHLHGTADQNHPIDGGIGSNSISDTNFHSAAYSVETAATAMGCETRPTSSSDATNPDLAVTSWVQCAGGVEVRLVAVDGATHSWMGHVASNPAASPSYAGLDASVVIVEFLLNHARLP
ncbi:MAG: phospholipase [Actinomycetia bacterium]|nr:phospholipase [Actinomycetes bacterium]